MTGTGRRRRARVASPDSGSAIVEFVFVAVVVMVPLVYLLVAVAVVERTRLAVTQAARDAGRALVASARAGQGEVRVQTAVRLALAAQGLPDDAAVRFVAPGADCSGPPIRPVLTPAGEFTICVTRTVALPAVPTVLRGRGITAVGRYTVHVDDFQAPGA